MRNDYGKPTNWLDNYYVTAKVFWQWRFDNELEADGIIFGFIEEPYPKGVVIEFPHRAVWRARYYVTQEHMSQVWQPDCVFYIQEARRLEVHNQPDPYEDIGKVRDLCRVVLDRRRVPVWTQFR